MFFYISNRRVGFKGDTTNVSDVVALFTATYYRPRFFCLSAK